MKIVITALCTVAALSLAPAAQADGNSANLDAIVGQAYMQFMRGCVPTQASQFQRIVWDNDGPGGQGGSGPQAV